MANTWSKEDTEAARSILLEHLKQNGDGWFTFNSSRYARDMGVNQSTISRYLNLFMADGIIESKGSSNRFDGLTLRVVADSERHTENGERHTQDSERHDEKPLRKCRRCGTEAANKNARFCWKCGETLLTEKELLKEEFNMTLNRICRFINDSRELQRITDTLDKVGKLAFKEE